MRKVPLLVLLLVTGILMGAAPSDPVLDAMEAELKRARAELREGGAPYFISAEITETDQLIVTARDGAHAGSTPFHWRWVDVDLRLGAPDFDSSHPLRQGFNSSRGGRPVPITKDKKLIQHVVWLEVDQAYRAAKERWASVQAEKQVLAKEPPAPDLAPTKTHVHLTPRRPLKARDEEWKEIAREVSAVFAVDGVVNGTVTLTGNEDTHWFVTTQGTRIRHHESRYRVDVTAGALADDGTLISLRRAFDSRSIEGLPKTKFLLQQARKLAADLRLLAKAPLEEPYTGPAILSDRAAAVFFHEILGHRLEGHRLKQADSAQTFRNRVNTRILPTFINVYDDPTLTSLVGIDLRGHYEYDNEGVKSSRVELVINGVLKDFLQSRAPFARGQASNGHGRRQPGMASVTRQGSLIVSASESVSNEVLRTDLLRRVKKRGKKYGLIIDEIIGGFTFTDRYMPNAFKIDVALARRVYLDGRPDEVVRGLDLIGTPMESFSKIVRAGELKAVFNGQCGAESGWIPVSAAAPSLLLSDIETQRTPKGQETMPLISPPVGKKRGGKAVQ